MLLEEIKRDAEAAIQRAEDAKIVLRQQLCECQRQLNQTHDRMLYYAENALQAGKRIEQLEGELAGMQVVIDQVREQQRKLNIGQIIATDPFTRRIDEMEREHKVDRETLVRLHDVLQAMLGETSPERVREAVAALKLKVRQGERVAPPVTAPARPQAPQPTEVSTTMAIRQRVEPTTVTIETRPEPTPARRTAATPIAKDSSKPASMRGRVKEYACVCVDCQVDFLHPSPNWLRCEACHTAYNVNVKERTRIDEQRERDEIQRGVGPKTVKTLGCHDCVHARLCTYCKTPTGEPCEHLEVGYTCAIEKANVCLPNVFARCQVKRT